MAPFLRCVVNSLLFCTAFLSMWPHVGLLLIE